MEFNNVRHTKSFNMNWDGSLMPRMASSTPKRVPDLQFEVNPKKKSHFEMKMLGEEDKRLLKIKYQAVAVSSYPTFKIAKKVSANNQTRRRRLYVECPEGELLVCCSGIDFLICTKSKTAFKFGFMLNKNLEDAHPWIITQKEEGELIVIKVWNHVRSHGDRFKIEWIHGDTILD